MTILIVDDDKNLTDALESSLLKKIPNIEIMKANSGEEGWKIIQNSQTYPSIVITDYRMPGWNGVDLA